MPITQHADDRVRSTVASAAKLPTNVPVDDAISAVMCTLTERITAGEAHDLLEALPKPLRPFFEVCVVHREGKPIAKLDRAEFLERVAKHLDVTPAHAELVCEAVFAAIRSELTDELVHNVAQQLPRGIQQLWLTEPRIEQPREVTVSESEARRILEDHIAEQVSLPHDVTSADAFSAVMCAFSQRLSGGESRDLLLGLPRAIRPLVDRCMVHRPEPAAVFDREELLARVAAHLHIDPVQAELIVRATFSGVKRLLPEKLLHDVASQLPPDLRELWETS